MKIVKSDTPQTDLDGEHVQKTEYITEDEDPGTYKAGDLDENGLTFRMCSIQEKEGRYKDEDGNPKPFWVVEGKRFNEYGTEEDITFMFGGQKLFKTLTKVKMDYLDKRDIGKGVTVNLSAHGQGYDRNYKVKIVE
jgi:hypothetical protein